MDEKFYTPQSDVVANVPTMLRTLGWIYLVMLLLAVVLINKRVMPTGAPPMTFKELPT